jgi:hypothetical protein
VDPDGVLDPKERARRAEHVRKAYFLQLSLASKRARAKKQALKAEEEKAASEKPPILSSSRLM